MHDLLPLSNEAPRCSEFAQQRGVLPLGSGLFLERVILVSVPLPWPKPATAHPALAAAAARIAPAQGGSRLFAMEPHDDQVHIEVYERRGDAARLSRWQLATPAMIDPVVAAIVAAPVGSLGDVRWPGLTLEVAGAEVGPTFLVCTQGTHDRCCGTRGVALADEIAFARPEHVVRRISHTGGHRFAPTLLAFPEGRMWAFADLALVDRIVAGTATPDDFETRSRGWWGAKVGPAQVAEGAVRARLATRPFAAPVVEPVVEPVAEPAVESLGADGRTQRFDVRTDGQSFRVAVQVERLVPTITCEAPGGLPAKPGREFGWSFDPESATVVR